MFRSDQDRGVSRLKAAWIAPEMFQTGVVRAHLFPLRPSSKDRWDALLAVSFTVPLADSSGAPQARVFGAVLRQGPIVAHRFQQTVALQPDSPDVTSAPVVTFLEPVTVAPGGYVLTTVLSAPGEPSPHAAKARFEVPEVPRRELFIVEPLLGRRAGANLVVRGDTAGKDDRIAPENAFEPLLVRDLEQPRDLVALTQVCWVGKNAKKPTPRKVVENAVLHRALRSVEDPEVARIEPIEVSLDDEGLVRCQNVVDVLPGDRLPDGAYTFEASLDARGVEPESGVRTIEFALDRPEVSPRPEESP